MFSSCQGHNFLKYLLVKTYVSSMAYQYYPLFVGYKTACQIDTSFEKSS